MALIGYWLKDNLCTINLVYSISLIFNINLRFFIGIINNNIKNSTAFKQKIDKSKIHGLQFIIYSNFKRKFDQLHNKYIYLVLKKEVNQLWEDERKPKRKH